MGLQKKDIILSEYAILQVSTHDCCKRDCMHHFLRRLIKTLCYEMHWEKCKENQLSILMSITVLTYVMRSKK